jgi:hypothetical protein
MSLKEIEYVEPLLLLGGCKLGRGAVVLPRAGFQIGERGIMKSMAKELIVLPVDHDVG